MWGGWVELGLPPDDFWNATLREYDLICSAKVRARNSEIEARRHLNFELSQLVMVAFHDPKKLADTIRRATPTRQKPDMTEKEAAIAMRSAFVGMFHRSKARGEKDT